MYYKFDVLMRELGYLDAFHRYTPLNDDELNELVIIENLVKCWELGCRLGIRYPRSRLLGKDLDMRSLSSEIEQRVNKLYASVKSRHASSLRQATQ